MKAKEEKTVTRRERQDFPVNKLVADTWASRYTDFYYTTRPSGSHDKKSINDTEISHFTSGVALAVVVGVSMLVDNAQQNALHVQRTRDIGLGQPLT